MGEKKKFDYTEQTFAYEDDEGNGVSWLVKDVIEHVKKLPVVQLEVKQFTGFLDYTVKNYDADDWYRVAHADLKYPIVVGAGTFTFTEDVTKGSYPVIIDGVHRLVKALHAGRPLIKAVVTNTLPAPMVTGKGMRIGKLIYEIN